MQNRHSAERSDTPHPRAKPSSRLTDSRADQSSSPGNDRCHQPPQSTACSSTSSPRRRATCSRPWSARKSWPLSDHRRRAEAGVQRRQHGRVRRPDQRVGRVLQHDGCRQVITASMLGIEPASVNGELPDAIGELTNTLAGSFRTRVAHVKGEAWAARRGFSKSRGRLLRRNQSPAERVH